MTTEDIPKEETRVDGVDKSVRVPFDTSSAKTGSTYRLYNLLPVNNSTNGPNPQYVICEAYHDMQQYDHYREVYHYNKTIPPLVEYMPQEEIVVKQRKKSSIKEDQNDATRDEPKEKLNDNDDNNDEGGIDSYLTFDDTDDMDFDEMTKKLEKTADGLANNDTTIASTTFLPSAVVSNKKESESVDTKVHHLKIGKKAGMILVHTDKAESGGEASVKNRGKIENDKADNKQTEPTTVVNTEIDTGQRNSNDSLRGEDDDDKVSARDQKSTAKSEAEMAIREPIVAIAETSMFSRSGRRIRKPVLLTSPSSPPQLPPGPKSAKRKAALKERLRKQKRKLEEQIKLKKEAKLREKPHVRTPSMTARFPPLPPLPPPQHQPQHQPQQWPTYPQPSYPPLQHTSFGPSTMVPQQPPSYRKSSYYGQMMGPPPVGMYHTMSQAPPPSTSYLHPYPSPVPSAPLPMPMPVPYGNVSYSASSQPPRTPSMSSSSSSSILPGHISHGPIQQHHIPPYYPASHPTSNMPPAKKMCRDNNDHLYPIAVSSLAMNHVEQHSVHIPPSPTVSSKASTSSGIEVTQAKMYPEQKIVQPRDNDRNITVARNDKEYSARQQQHGDPRNVYSGPHYQPEKYSIKPVLQFRDAFFKLEHGDDDEDDDEDDDVDDEDEDDESEEVEGGTNAARRGLSRYFIPNIHRYFQAALEDGSYFESYDQYNASDLINFRHAYQPQQRTRGQCQREFTIVMKQDIGNKKLIPYIFFLLLVNGVLSERSPNANINEQKKSRQGEKVIIDIEEDPSPPFLNVNSATAPASRTQNSLHHQEEIIFIEDNVMEQRSENDDIGYGRAGRQGQKKQPTLNVTLKRKQGARGGTAKRGRGRPRKYPSMNAVSYYDNATTATAMGLMKPTFTCAQNERIASAEDDVNKENWREANKPERQRGQQLTAKVIPHDGETTGEKEEEDGDDGDDMLTEDELERADALRYMHTAHHLNDTNAFHYSRAQEATITSTSKGKEREHATTTMMTGRGGSESPSWSRAGSVETFDETYELISDDDEDSESPFLKYSNNKQSGPSTTTVSAFIQQRKRFSMWGQKRPPSVLLTEGATGEYKEGDVGNTLQDKIQRREDREDSQNTVQSYSHEQISIAGRGEECQLTYEHPGKLSRSRNSSVTSLPSTTTADTDRSSLTTQSKRRKKKPGLNYVLPSDDLICMVCQQHDMPQSTWDAYRFPDDYLQKLEETKETRRPGFTGRGTSWDPRVYIQCEQCSIKVHCGCVQPPVKGYPVKYRAFLCTVCDEKEKSGKQIPIIPAGGKVSRQNITKTSRRSGAHPVSYKM
ncbi:hypothetical protein BDF20DRAFT_886541 [Mycotypha africana]|uniref:uncharacterized protein n=1 Tax=Mycotypha africana TaxID=64632 RepID=UPI0022FFE495|nr:uncharacterized protein BDF20DRAFT_886541 [Mycotypha africana]KAI8971806.1 hypothetical protein BDF20DRAFT_886541 [Mycotypha africana]